MKELLVQHRRTILTAWMYFTRVPLPKVFQRYTDGSQQSLEQSVRLLPLFGIAVGATAGLVFSATNSLLDNKELAVLFSMITSIIVTGALHEDGLGDFFDGFGGGWWSKEKILEIMKDSRMGTFGTLALILALAVKYQLLVSLPSELIPATLIAGHACSRFAAGSFFFTDDYVRANDQSYFKPMAKGRMSMYDFWLMGILGILPIALMGDIAYWALLLPVGAGRVLFGDWFIKKLGGYTGDCLGATQQITELAFYLGALYITHLLV